MPPPDPQLPQPTSDDKLDEALSLIRQLLTRVKRLEAAYYGTPEEEAQDIQISQIRASILNSYGKRNKS